jgi:hypothetical protein
VTGRSAAQPDGQGSRRDNPGIGDGHARRDAAAPDVEDASPLVVAGERVAQDVVVGHVLSVWAALGGFPAPDDRQLQQPVTKEELVGIDREIRLGQGGGTRRADDLVADVEVLDRR